MFNVLVIIYGRRSILVQLSILWLYAKLPTVITPSLIDSLNELYIFTYLKSSDPRFLYKALSRHIQAIIEFLHYVTSVISIRNT